jgi:hypothetical protein
MPLHNEMASIKIITNIIIPQNDEVTGKSKRLHNEELYDLFSSPSIIRVIKSRRMRWAVRVARMGRGEVHIGF